MYFIEKKLPEQCCIFVLMLTIPIKEEKNWLLAGANKPFPAAVIHFHSVMDYVEIAIFSTIR